MKKLTPIILAALVIWMLGGADEMDINGSAQMTGRPQPFQWATAGNTMAGTPAGTGTGID